MAESEIEPDVEMEELRAELARLREAVAERTQEMRDAVRERAAVVRENPGTFASALVLGGLIGLLVGTALSHTEPPHRRWMHW